MGSTETVAVPLSPSLSAWMVTEPADTPVTRPVESTVAVPGSVLDQVTNRSLSRLSAESRTSAWSWTVPPSTTVALLGDTVTLATGTELTVTDAVPAIPSLVAVIVASPKARAVTSPVSDTDATVGALLLHATLASGT